VSIGSSKVYSKYHHAIRFFDNPVLFFPFFARICSAIILKVTERKDFSSSTFCVLRSLLIWRLALVAGIYVEPC